MGKSRQQREMSGLFEPDADFPAVVGSLEQLGVSRDKVALCTPMPLEYSPEVRCRFLPYLTTIAAGVVGIGVGVFFAAGTALFYPLMTGGKAIVAAPVVGIISYETMMLLAVLATFVTVIVRIVRDRDRMASRDPRIDDALVAVVIALDTETRESDVSKVLADAGARDIAIRSAATASPGKPRDQAVLIRLMVTVLCSLFGGCSRDMQDQPSYKPQETPRRHSPAGSMPRESRAILSPTRMESADAPARGQRLYRVNCLHCHGADGDGTGPVAAYLKEKPADLRSDTIQNKTHAELYEIVSQGKDVMPAFRGELSADERDAVAHYVKSLGRAHQKSQR
jgi:mono/diheme cytochrome c family protein